MTDTPEIVRERAEHHANEAERLLKSWWLSTSRASYLRTSRGRWPTGHRRSVLRSAFAPR
jgi:hypothetical protein